MTYNAKKLIKNAYRITKDRGITCLRIRIPGGELNVKHFDNIKEIAEKYGSGNVHITARQGLEVPGIPMEKIDEVNKLLAPLIRDMEKKIGVNIQDEEAGYPSAGTRNICACIGNQVCPYSFFDTKELTYKIEKAIYPNDYHLKVAISGCPNDCIKAHLQDVGILGMVEPVYDFSRCIACPVCVDVCHQRATGALSMINYSIERDTKRCIGCGECILECPNKAWNWGNTYFQVVILGRGGKLNPRLARPFLSWVDEDTVIKVLKNIYDYIDKYIDRSLPKELLGYIVDRTGYQTFKEEVLKDVELGEKARVARYMDLGGYYFDRNHALMEE